MIKMLAQLFRKLGNYLSHNKHFVLLLYTLIYVPWFMYLEKKVTMDSRFHVIHMAIDDRIPFCEYFIIPYYLWFVYMGLAIVYIAFNDGKTCWKMGLFLLTGMTLFLTISTVYPNGHYLRPDSFARDNLFVDLVKKIYATDTSTNLFPSIHVYNTMGCHFALLHSEVMMSQKKWQWVKPVSWTLLVLITLSTLFTKQHSMFDVITALILGVVMYIICYGPLEKRFDRWWDATHRKEILHEQ